MNDKIGCFIINIEGTDLTQEDKDVLRHPLVGGVVLFARNYKSRHQLNELCLNLRKVRKTPLLITVDQEGGRVQRFQDEFTRLPQMALFGQIYNQNAKGACELAKECGWLMATELLTTGVDLSFAPVLDLYKSINKAIGDRAFHAEPDAIIQLASAFIAGMHEAGMASTGKHFPGHGSVGADSHVAIPIDTRQFIDIENSDLIPFAGMIKAGITAIMASHIVYPAIDNLPVGFSRKWLHDILRQKLNFRGILFSDDLNMEGANISTNYADRVQAALDAGCDFALLCNNRAGVIQVLDHLPYTNRLVEKQKWGSLAGNWERTPRNFVETPRWQHVVNELTQLGNNKTHERYIGT